MQHPSLYHPVKGSFEHNSKSSSKTFFCLSADKQKNVLDEDLELCSNDPLTGWYRDGCCNTDENDHGVHTVCAKVNTEFLEWCKEAGNDLITPHPEFGFPGLKDGDSWCVCAGWYARARAYQPAQTHQLSPSFKPGKPNSG